MIVGIVDLDLILNRSTYQLNLDVMQIASYYKKRGHTVRLSYSMKLQDLMSYNLIYVIYNGSDDIFIDELAKDSRVSLIGRYFYRDRTILPQDILDSYTDKVLYENLLRTNYFSETRRNELGVYLRNADFVRIHQPSNLNFISPNSKQIAIYDLDITIADYEYIKSLNKSFLLFYPIKTRTLAEALKWLEMRTIGKATKKVMFITDYFTDDDLNKFMTLSNVKRKMFMISFGNCSEDYYNLELKRFIKFAQKAKKLVPKPKIEIKPIKDPDYQFLFNTVRCWYGSKKDTNNLSIFKYGFTKPEHFKLMLKIKAKDPELTQLLTSTLYTRYQNEQARQNYRRVD